MTNVKPNHPLAEIVARKLLGISAVPFVAQRAMINRAAMAAVDFHESEISHLKELHAEVSGRNVSLKCENLELRGALEKIMNDSWKLNSVPAFQVAQEVLEKYKDKRNG